ncbi:MAG TPA: hypothetical protein VJ644_12550 [Jiangellaceae bacterium]|nr:hypothetical protein [Jiangellaceae bacterium]
MAEQRSADTGEPGSGHPSRTGDARIDTALAALDGLDEAPVHEHAAAIEEVHGSLQDALADEDEDG